MSLFWNHQAKRGWGTDEPSDLDTTGLLDGTTYAHTSASEIYVWSGFAWKPLGSGSQHVSSASEDCTVTALDGLVVVDATAGHIVVTLPDAHGLSGRSFTIKRIDGSANEVAVQGYDGDTIDDGASQSVGQYDALKVTSNNTEWWIT